MWITRMTGYYNLGTTLYYNAYTMSDISIIVCNNIL